MGSLGNERVLRRAIILDSILHFISLRPKCETKKQQKKIKININMNDDPKTLSRALQTRIGSIHLNDIDALDRHRSSDRRRRSKLCQKDEGNDNNLVGEIKCAHRGHLPCMGT